LSQKPKIAEHSMGGEWEQGSKAAAKERERAEKKRAIAENKLGGKKEPERAGRTWPFKHVLQRFASALCITFHNIGNIGETKLAIGAQR